MMMMMIITIIIIIILKMTMMNLILNYEIIVYIVLLYKIDLLHISPYSLSMCLKLSH